MWAGGVSTGAGGGTEEEVTVAGGGWVGAGGYVRTARVVTVAAARETRWRFVGTAVGFVRWESVQREG